MPRFLVERVYPAGLILPSDGEGAARCSAIADRNGDFGVTWLHSYVSTDKARSYCIYDGPSPDAIRTAASRSSLPVTRISEVRVLDPFFYF